MPCKTVTVPGGQSSGGDGTNGGNGGGDGGGGGGIGGGEDIITIGGVGINGTELALGAGLVGAAFVMSRRESQQ